MPQCRICLQENSDVEDLIKPCNCDGTQKFVHRKCLETWLEYNIDSINHERCQECLSNYKFEVIKYKNSKFSFL